MCVFIYLCMPKQEFMCGHRWIQGEGEIRGWGWVVVVVSVYALSGPAAHASCLVWSPLVIA